MEKELAEPLSVEREMGPRGSRGLLGETGLIPPVEQETAALGASVPA